MTREPNISWYLEQHLKTSFVGKVVHYFPVTSSTMDEARKLAEQNEPEGTVVIAGRQETGRGRKGRFWLSPEGGLATSIILRTGAQYLHLLPAISAVAVYRVIRRMGINASIKWPNDVVISDKKVCGILIENAFEEGKPVFSIVGIGINVNFDPAGFPEIKDIATSLSAETGKQLSIAEVALSLYSEIEVLYNRINDRDFILGEWTRNMDTIGRRVNVNTGNRTLEGVAEAVNHEGNLVLRLDDGSIQEVMAGDVTNVRDKT